MLTAAVTPLVESSYSSSSYWRRMVSTPRTLITIILECNNSTSSHAFMVVHSKTEQMNKVRFSCINA